MTGPDYGDEELAFIKNLQDTTKDFRWSSVVGFAF